LSDNNKKQAMMPEGCQVLPNDNGSAAGVFLEQDGRVLILLPGPPEEMQPMFVRYAADLLRAKTDGVFVSRTLKITGIGESLLVTRLKALIDAQTNPTIAPYAELGEARLRLTASAKDAQQAQSLIAPVASAVYNQLGTLVYGEDDDTLASVVLELLKQKQLTLACAESCTGGLLTAALVDVPGSSEVLAEGIIAYSNPSKINRLRVPEAVLQAYGAVSGQTAEAMAQGAAQTGGARVGLSTTGIAGPGGGTAEKPVGLVYLGLYIEGQGTQACELRLHGSRNDIRRRAVVRALDFLRKALL
jgi:nicotinamide-nucleotide amidase